MAAPDHDEQAQRRTVRLRDVAEAAGVDTSIASRILSGDGALTVRPDTRQRVLEAASRLAYRPNTAARTLKTRKTMAIGMIVPELTNVAYATIALGADERASRAGYALLVATGSVRDRLDAIDGRIDGLLVGIATSETVRIGDLGGPLPTVLVNRHELLGLPSVTVDDEAGSALATEHLLSLGHRHIGHVAGPQNSDTGRRRLAGYERAMRAAGSSRARAGRSRPRTTRRAASSRPRGCCAPRRGRRRSSSRTSGPRSAPWRRRSGSGSRFPATSRWSASTTRPSRCTSTRS